MWWWISRRSFSSSSFGMIYSREDVRHPRGLRDLRLTAGLVRMVGAAIFEPMVEDRGGERSGLAGAVKKIRMWAS
jgi:hypothetical protein